MIKELTFCVTSWSVLLKPPPSEITPFLSASTVCSCSSVLGRAEGLTPDSVTPSAHVEAWCVLISKRK